jgi:hypothetical protein
MPPSLGAANTYGYTGLLGQTQVPKAPNLSGVWNPTTKQFDLNSVLSQLQTSQDQANQANVKRYNDLLQSIQNTSSQVTGAGGTYSQAMGLMDTLGQTAATRIGQETEQNLAANQQNLTSRGLGNTTVGVNLDQQSRQQGEQALQASQESIAGQKAGVLQNLAGAQLNIGSMQQRGIESLNQQAPNMALYSDMIKSATQGEAQTQSSAAAAARVAQQTAQAGIDNYQKGGGMMGGGSSSGGGSSGGGISPLNTGGSTSGGPSGGGWNIPGQGLEGAWTSGPTGNNPSQAGGVGMDQQYPNLAGASSPQSTTQPSSAFVPQGAGQPLSGGADASGIGGGATSGAVAPVSGGADASGISGGVGASGIGGGVGATAKKYVNMMQIDPNAFTQALGLGNIIQEPGTGKYYWAPGKG